MSAQDYAGFLTRLRRQFPDESFLLISSATTSRTSPQR